ncbi:MAG: nodulation protein NfeD [Desulfobacterota bacterium]|nr:nodulation protein NfeD [Thermodesulfobacteriota bacterium]
MKYFIFFVTVLFVLLAKCTILYAATVNVIRIEDAITPVIAEFVIKNIEQAEREAASCLILELDTPGGLDLAMRNIIKHIMASEVPVIVYVAPAGARAASAGAIITLASHIAAMAPGTNIGAAHPVNLGGGDMGKEMAAKVENDAAAYVESIAIKRGRNKEWAIKAVRESVSISETEALKLKVIDIISPDLPSLLNAIDGREIETASGKRKLETKEAVIRYRTMGVRENILQTLANPNIAYILLLIGLAGLYFELSNPGAIFPGVLGGISLILAFYSLQSLSANYAGVLLILLGILLFILEIKIVSYGLLSIGGIIAITLGSLMLFQSDIPSLRLSWSVIIPSVIFIWLFFVVIIGLVVKAQRRQPTTGIEGILNMVGEACTDIHDTGKVFVNGEYWNARSDTFIHKGEKIRVRGIEGLTLSVVKAYGKSS